MKPEASTLKSHFDFEPNLIYLNSGTHSICPRVVRDKIRDLRIQYERNPTRSLMEVWGKLWQVQVDLGRYLDAEPATLFLRSNVTQALNEIILGLPLPASSQIVISDLEYGAVARTCRYRAERDGLNLAPLRLPLCPSSEQEVVDSVTKQVAALAAPSLVVLSHITSPNGLRVPIAPIASILRDRGIHFVVDGAHGPGATPLNFAELARAGVDAYAGNLHKWMMGPKGTAFGWVHPQHHNSIRPSQAGWTTYDPPPFFDAFGERNLFTLRFALLGCQDFSPFLGIPTMLEFWRTVGCTRILETLRHHQILVDESVAQYLGWERLSPGVDLRGPLVSFALPEHLHSRRDRLSGEILESTQVQIIVTETPAGPSMRFSPHINLDETDLIEGIRRIADHLEV